VEKFKLSGGCQCGAVRYTIHAPALETVHCHCGMCRKVHGALFVTLSAVRRDEFTIDKGAESLGTFDSSPPMHRRFCTICGCPLFIEMDDVPELIEIATGTLDGGAHPGHPRASLKHLWVGSKVPWYEITDDLPRFEEAAPED
ncbi:MAG: GFA family protein, partial [Acidobacteriota bacterium]